MTLQEIQSGFQDETLLDTLDTFNEEITDDKYTVEIGAVDAVVTAEVMIAQGDVVQVNTSAAERNLIGTFTDTDSAVLFLESALMELLVGATDGLGAEPVTE